MKPLESIKTLQNNLTEESAVGSVPRVLAIEHKLAALQDKFDALGREEGAREEQDEGQEEERDGPHAISPLSRWDGLYCTETPRMSRGSA